MAHAATQHQSESMQWLVDAMRRMIRPIIRLAVGNISCPALLRIVREIYVTEAQAHLEREGKRPSKSAMALLSGLDGRAISSIQQESMDEADTAQICPEAAILEAWELNPEFQDAAGRPADLPIAGASGSAERGSFTRLARMAAGRHVTANVALSRLEEAGNIEFVKRSDGFENVRLVNRVYMPIREQGHKVGIIAASVSYQNLGKSVLHNLGMKSEGEPGVPANSKWVQQDRWSMRIAPDRVPVLRKALRDSLLAHIREVESILGAEELNAQDGDEIDLSQVGVGWFYWDSSSRPTA